MLEIANLCDETAWSDWHPLEGCWRGTTLPACSGLYRIRMLHDGHYQMAYIGQSGNLKERLAAMNNVFKDIMPYRAPHTAAPCLWAWRQVLPASSYEVSVASFPQVSATLRLGLESLAIALSRKRWGVSPLANFGRMPQGWASSSGNDADLVARGKRFRGGPTTELLECHLPGIVPVGSLIGDPHAREWGGHIWTPWVSVNSIRPAHGEEGLYRLRMPGCEPLLLIGSGKLADRLKIHSQRKDRECSWVTGSWYAHQKQELLCDLLGAYMLVKESVPLWQFAQEHGGPDNEALRKVS